MKYIIKDCFCWFFLSSFFFLSFSHANTLPPELVDWSTKNPVVSIAIDNSFPPYDFVDKHGAPRGIGESARQRLNEILPLTLQVPKPLAFAEGLKAVQSHQIDTISICANTKEREGTVLFSEPLLKLTPVLVVHKDSTIKAVEDIDENHHIGVTQAYATVNYARQLSQNENVFEAPTTETGIKKVANGALDGFVSYLLESEYLTSQAKIKNTRLVPLNHLSAFNASFCIDNNKPELKAILDWGIKQLGSNFIKEEKQRWELSSKGAKVELSDRSFQLYAVAFLGILVTLFLTLWLARRYSQILALKVDSLLFKINLVVVIFIILGTISFAMKLYLDNYREVILNNIQEKFDLTYEVTQKNLIEWFHTRKDVVELTAKSRVFVSLVSELTAQEPNVRVIRSVEKALRDFFSHRSSFQINNRSFNIISLDGTHLFNSDPTLEGKVSTIKRTKPTLFGRVVKGETVFFPPVWSDVDMDGNTSEWDKDPAIFIASPIKSEQGRIIAILALRLDPSNRYSSLFNEARLGESFETYGIDDDGFIISESRFVHELQADELVPYGESAILNVKLSDEKRNAILLAVSLSEHGKNLAGYLDYFDTKVVGEWTYLPLFNMTLVSEINYDELYEDYRKLSRIFVIVVLLIATLMLSLSIFMIVISQRANQINRRSQAELESEVNRQTQDLIKAKEVADKATQKTVRLMESTPVAIFVFNGNKCIEQVNQAACELVGYEKEEIIGQNLNFMVPEERLEQQKEDLEHFIKQSYLYDENGAKEQMPPLTREQVSIVTKDQNIIAVDAILSPSGTGDEKLFILGIRDVTNEIKAKNALVEAKEISEDASKAKSDFLANMSHEIRTPMNAIIGMSHLALDYELPAKPRSYVTKVHRAANSLLGIINDILDFSKIEAGKLDIEHINFNIEDVFNDLANIVGLKTSEKGLELLFNISPEVPVTLCGDPLRINQILSNLGTNAAKFTHEGQILVSVNVTEKIADKIQLTFSVKDTGIGMSEELQAKLFKSFTQADTSTTRKYGGTGLGLTICQKLVHMMKGEIYLHSQEQVGSEFVFTLWLEVPEQVEDSKFSSELTQVLQGRDVLLVDDNPSALAILTEIMESFGCKVTTAHDGLTALTIVESGREFDFALIDWKMPGIDGIETCERLYQMSPQRIEHLMLVTAHGKDDVKARVESNPDVAIDSFLEKPVTSSTVFDEMMRHIGPAFIQTTNQGKRTDELKVNQKAVAGSHILLVEDNDLNQELAMELLRQAHVRVDLAENGKEALEKASNQTYDAILMDLQMPIMDGYTATNIIRQTQPELPIIAMTANAMAGDKEKVLAAGMNDHIAKPIVLNDMFSTIAKWVTPSDVEEVASSMKEDVVHSIQDNLVESESYVGRSLTYVDVEKGLGIANHNQGLYQKLLKKFVDGHRSFYLDFGEAWGEGYMVEATRIAHNLKGTAGNIGAEPLYMVASKLEKHCDNHAEHEIMSNCFKSTQAALQNVLSELDVFLEEAKSQNIQTEHKTLAIEKELLQEKLTALAQLLENFEIGSVDSAEEIAALIKESEYANPFNNVLKAIENYDFDDATARLTQFIATFSL